MEAAKAAVKDFTTRHGHNDTTVHEHSKPAVTHEHVTQTRHDEGRTVVDKEVHQDHYHTSVQPIQDREVLPEKHEHNLLPTEKKEFHHGDSHDTKERLAGEAAKYTHATETGETKYTQSTKPEVAGEHVHHHIHETIQPVIQKETIDPTVVHTTKPIHEVHHNAPQHHTASVLPAVNLADFQGNGGHLEGAKERVTHFEGEPGQQKISGGTHHIGETGHTGTHHTGGSHHTGTHHTSTHGAGVVGGADRGLTGETDRTGAHHTGTHGAGVVGGADRGLSGTDRTDRPVGGVATGDTLSSSKKDSIMDRERPVAGHRGAETTTTGALGSGNTEPGLAQKMDPRVDTRREHAGGAAGSAPVENRSHHPSTTNEPLRKEFADTHLGAGEGGNATYNSNFEAANVSHGSHGHEPVAAAKKPSLLDKLNPMKDADGDGKKGIMK